MSEVVGVRRIDEAGLVGTLSAPEREVIAGLSEAEFEALSSIKHRLEEAIGVDTVHGPEDGGLFW